MNHSEVVTDAVVFEVVGKFTSGCETSESENASSEDEEYDEEDEDEDFDEDEGPETTSTSVPPNGDAAIPTTAAPLAPGLGIQAKWLHTWRRQSIA